MVDPFYPLQEGNAPIEGDGNVCALRIKDGRVDLKIRYVDTERLVSPVAHLLSVRFVVSWLTCCIHTEAGASSKQALIRIVS